MKDGDDLMIKGIIKLVLGLKCLNESYHNMQIQFIIELLSLWKGIWTIYVKLHYRKNYISPLLTTVEQWLALEYFNFRQLAQKPDAPYSTSNRILFIIFYHLLGKQNYYWSVIDYFKQIEKVPGKWYCFISL